MKTALVTGASGGIGKAIAKKLVENGYIVAATYNNGRSCELENTISFKCDISSFSQVQNLYLQVIEQLGHIDLVVNNAGVAFTGLLQDMSGDEIDKIISTDLNGTIYSTKFAADYMVKKHSGNIINISSVWGVCGASCEAVYSAAKGGIIAFTKAMAKELGTSGIRVNCISPGVIKTKMLDCYSEEDLKNLEEETLLARLGTPEDIAQAVLFLASDESSFITGQNLVVDGGFIL